MNEQVNLPPAPRPGGCCGVGCVALIALLLFLICAFVGGVFWAIHHVSRTYSETAPITLPDDVTSEMPVAVEGSGVTTSSAPMTTPVPVQAVDARWKAFEKAAERHENVRIELTASEINALLQKGRNTRGKVFVSIENNIARVRFSVPLKNVPLMGGRYVNGEGSVEASPDGDPEKARITNIVLANNSVPDGIVDRSFFGWASLSSLISDWLHGQQVTSLRIENNRIMGETNGTR